MLENRYINLVKTSLEVIRNSRVPLHSSKFSKKKYSQHQLLCLIILKEDIGKDYRDFVKLIQIMVPLREIVGLKEVPHFTTLQKFMARVPSLTLKIILKTVVRRLHQKDDKIKITSIDATLTLPL